MQDTYDAKATKFAYRLNPGDRTNLGTVSKAVSGEGTTEVWFEEGDERPIILKTLDEVAVYFTL